MLTCNASTAPLVSFFRFGKVQGAIVMLDKNTDRSRGFGFVTFADGNTIDSVLACEAHDIGGRIVDVKRALPRSSAPPRKVTIYNLRRERGNSHHYGGSGGGGQSRYAYVTELRRLTRRLMPQRTRPFAGLLFSFLLPSSHALVPLLPLSSSRAAATRATTTRNVAADAGAAVRRAAAAAAAVSTAAAAAEAAAAAAATSTATANVAPAAAVVAVVAAATRPTLRLLAAGLRGKE